MITSAHIKRLRKIVTPYFFDTVTVYFPPDPATVTRRLSGAAVSTYPDDWTQTASVLCRIVESRLSGNERMGAGKRQSTSFLRISFPHDTLIDETCRIRVTAAKFCTHLIGLDYDIIEVPPSSFNVYRRALASRTTT